MKCPVCPRSNIPDDAIVCPNCGVSLVPQRRVHELGLVNFNEALRLATVGATDIAICRATTAMTMDEHFLPARTLLGKLLWKRGYILEAQEQWQQAAAMAPDDEEIRRLLSEARCHVRRHLAIRVAAIALGVFIVLGLIFAMTVLPLRMVNSRLDTLSAKLDTEFQSTRAEYVRITAEAARWKQDAQVANTLAGELSKKLVGYRRLHSHTDAEYAIAVNEREHLQQNIEVIRSSLAAEHAHCKQMASQVALLGRQVKTMEAAKPLTSSELSQALTATKDAAAIVRSLGTSMNTERRCLLESLIAILRGMRPEGADKPSWENAIRHLQSELKSLEDN